MSPIFFLQTPHLFFFGLLGLDLSDGVSDATEQMESSFLRFELAEGIGVNNTDVELEEELLLLFVIGTGALLAITLALELFEGIRELFGVLFEEELVDIAMGVDGFISEDDFTAVVFVLSAGLFFSCVDVAFFIFSSRFLSSAL